jgi:hypothetical protein
MRRARVEMIHHLRCANCASAYRNLGRAVWRLHRDIKVDVGLLPATTPAASLQECDFELHCLIQHMQSAGSDHAPMQTLMDTMVDRATAISSREEAWDLAVRIGIEPQRLAESATAVHHALARVAAFHPIRVPGFLIDDEHLLQGNASPAFLHDVLQALAKPRRTTARNLWTGLSKWTS